MSDPKKSESFRTWAILEGNSLSNFIVPDVDAAIWLLIGLTRRNRNEAWVSAEAYGLEIYSMGEWIEWSDEEGENIIFYIEKMMR